MHSPAPNPGNLAAQATAEVDRRLIHALLGGGRPELERVAMTLAPMTRVATTRHVPRETATTTAGTTVMQGTASIPLGPRPTRRLEPQPVQDLLHRHDRANALEVNARHGSRPRSPGTMVRPFRSRSSLEGERERPLRSFHPDVANPRACGTAGRLAPATPAPRPAAGSSPRGIPAASLGSRSRPGSEAPAPAAPGCAADRRG